MILLLRASDIAIDSRMLRLCRALAQSDMPHAVAYWDRGVATRDPADIPTIPFISPLRYGSRRATALRILRVNLFFLATIWRRRRDIGLIHAADLDSAVAAWIMHRLIGIPFVYDVYDHYADSRGLTGLLRRGHDWLERRLLRDAALVILADEARLAQHGPIAPDRLMVIENVPALAQRGMPSEPDGNGRLKIGYLGTFEAVHRGLEDLIAVVEADARLELRIAGDGVLAGDIARAAARCPRIRLHPPLEHDAGLAMLAACDIVAGLYYLSVPNHRFAAPNKYYEHLLLSRPLLTSRGTPPGAKVIVHDTGWAVADSAPAIAQALEDALADPEAMRAKGQRAGALWRARYADYVARHLAGDYVAAVRRSARPVTRGRQGRALA